ncbi:hypothetical protein, partial [Neisseria sicca]|uniref:preprotein translocase subunit SecA n=1 Tax=Neisseria sicca TaxID=490 RepID=UPI0034D9839C
MQNSHLVSNLLQKPPLPHNLLNPKQHQPQPLILPQPPKLPPITLPTNIPRRPTDIVLRASLKHQIQPHFHKKPYTLKLLHFTHYLPPNLPFPKPQLH